LVKGKVTKVNLEIMDLNWIHIQDGTAFNDQYDLTLTNKETAEVGEIITFEGKLALDKDFGSGYFYALILEEAIKK